MFDFLLMVAMHGLLDFGTDKNAFVATGTFGFLVPLAALKKLLTHLIKPSLPILE